MFIFCRAHCDPLNKTPRRASSLSCNWQSLRQGGTENAQQATTAVTKTDRTNAVEGVLIIVFTFYWTVHCPLHHTLPRNDSGITTSHLESTSCSSKPPGGTCWSDFEKGYHEANFLNDFLVLLFLVGQQPLGWKKGREGVLTLCFLWHLVSTWRDSFTANEYTVFSELFLLSASLTELF